MLYTLITYSWDDILNIGRHDTAGITYRIELILQTTLDGIEEWRKTLFQGPPHEYLAQLSRSEGHLNHEEAALIIRSLPHVFTLL